VDNEIPIMFLLPTLLKDEIHEDYIKPTTERHALPNILSIKIELHGKPEAFSLNSFVVNVLLFMNMTIVKIFYICKGVPYTTIVLKYSIF